MQDLKAKTIRGGVARVTAQVANFAFRIGSLMILARLLSPKDFGLVGMVTAFTGVLNLFRDFGLSAASVQRDNLSKEQASTLFWINVLVGGFIAILAISLAPLVVRLYHEPRLFGITLVLSLGFVFNAAGVQQSALLQRQLRFTALAVINVAALLLSTIVAVSLAKLSYGYWALVTMTVTLTLTTTIGLWITTAWVPGPPRRGIGIWSIMRFGGTVTLNGLVTYTAYNLEKVLLGRFWGAEAIGIYGRAYQLITIPTDNLNSSVGEVAFSALSRVKSDGIRLRSYFLKGYSLVLGSTIPITIVCALFADDVVAIILGPRWKAAAIIFRLLAPTILIFAMINPLSWLLFSLGMVGRSLKMALVMGPLIVVGYLVGLRYGPKGVALGYSIAMGIWVVPHIIWCVRGTVVSFRDILLTVSRPLLSGLVAAIPAFGVHWLTLPLLSTFPRLLLEGGSLCIVYIAMLLYVMGQKTLYMDVLNGFRHRAPIIDKVLTPA